MSTRGFLGELGKGLVQLGTTYGQTGLANLEADAQRMKEERLQMMQMAQFGMQGTKNVYEMEMGEKRFGLLEEEAVRAKEKHQRTMDAPVGKWTLKEIEHRKPTTDAFGETTSVQLESTWVLVNDVTGEIKPYDGRFGKIPPPGDGTDFKMYSGPFEPWYQKHIEDAKSLGKTPFSRSEARKIAEGNGVVFDDKTNGKTPPPPEVDRKLIKDWDELSKMFPTPGGDMGEAWYEKQLIPDLGTNIATGAVTAAKAITDPRVMAAVYGFPFDVVTWFINQFLPADMVIDKPNLGSKMWGEWLEALAPHYEKGKQLTKEQILKIVPAITDMSKDNLTYAIDKWNQLDLGEKASRLKKWGETILEVNEDMRESVVDKVSGVAKKAIIEIADFVAHPKEAVENAIASLDMDNSVVIKILQEWDSQDIETINSFIDAVKAQIEKVLPPLDADAAKDTLEAYWEGVSKGPITDYWKGQIGSVTANLPIGEPVLPSLTQREPKPYPNVIVDKGKQDGLILPAETGSSIEDARETAMATAQATDLPAAAAPVFAEDASAYIGKGTQIPALPGADIPIDKSWIEAGIGRVSEIPFDKTTIVQIPTEVLIDELNDAQERIITPGITSDERQILEDNIVLIKGVLEVRERGQVGGIGVEHPSAGMTEGEYPILPPEYRPPTTDIESVSGGFQYPDMADETGNLRRAYNPPVRIAGVERDVDAAQLADFPPRRGGLIEPSDLRLGDSYDANIDYGTLTPQQIAQASGEKIGTSEIVLKKIMPDITKFVGKVEKAIEDDVPASAHRELLHDIYAAYYKVEDEINKKNYLRVLKAEMEKAGVADRKPGDWTFKYSTAVYGTIVDGAKWIDENIGTLYKPSGEVLYEEGTTVKRLTAEGYRRKDKDSKNEIMAQVEAEAEAEANSPIPPETRVGPGGGGTKEVAEVKLTKKEQRLYDRYKKGANRVDHPRAYLESMLRVFVRQPHGFESNIKVIEKLLAEAQMRGTKKK